MHCIHLFLIDLLNGKLLMFTLVISWQTLRLVLAGTKKIPKSQTIRTQITGWKYSCCISLLCMYCPYDRCISTWLNVLKMYLYSIRPNVLLLESCSSKNSFFLIDRKPTILQSKLLRDTDLKLVGSNSFRIIYYQHFYYIYILWFEYKEYFYGLNIFVKESYVFMWFL
jgi:hypothetical protein